MVSLLYRLPPRLRRAVARTRVGRIASPEMSAHAWNDTDWWTTFYAEIDPWGFSTNSWEAEKYARTLQLCGSGPFDSALEIGCGEGVFTEAVAPRCNRLLAVDISSVAVERAQARLHASPHVVVDERMLPHAMPEGPFDLIVASDVLYYWAEEDLRATLPVFEQILAPGGRLISVHFAPPMGTLLTGTEVHDVLKSLTLPNTHSEVMELSHGRWRVDRFDKPFVP